MSGAKELAAKISTAYALKSPRIILRIRLIKALTLADIEGKNPADILSEAYENLENAVSEFEISEESDGLMIFSSGKSYSSEKILCKNHMLKAHELLGSNEIYVSIPRRTCLSAIAGNAGEETYRTFICLHEFTWQDDSYGNAPIINALFVVTEGEITGIIPLDEQ